MPLGDDAAGLSATSIAGLTASWAAKYVAFRHRDLTDRDDVHVWMHGAPPSTSGLKDDRLCTLVTIGVCPRTGRTDLVALDDGCRESAESWSSVLRDLRRRRVRASAVAVGRRCALSLVGGTGRVAGDGPEATDAQAGARARQVAAAPAAAGEACAARRDLRATKRPTRRRPSGRSWRSSRRRRRPASWRTRRRC